MSSEVHELSESGDCRTGYRIKVSAPMHGSRHDHEGLLSK